MVYKKFTVLNLRVVLLAKIEMKTKDKVLCHPPFNLQLFGSILLYRYSNLFIQVTSQLEHVLILWTLRESPFPIVLTEFKVHTKHKVLIAVSQGLGHGTVLWYTAECVCKTVQDLCNLK